MKNIALCADLGGTNLRIAAIDDRGELLVRRKVPTPREGGPAAIVDTIAGITKECIHEVSGRGVPQGFALAVPAVLDSANGKIVESPNLPFLNDFHIASELCRQVSLPVYLENDANAAAIGEHWLGASKGYASSICITLGTGVGGGLIIDGKPLRGTDGTAGEIGHVNIEPNGHPCGCGSWGCLEQYASATAIVRLVGELKEKYPESELEVSDQLSAREVYEAGAAGDELAIAVFRRVGSSLGLACAGLVNILNPEVIVIGGGASAGWDLFIAEMTETLHARAFRRPAKRARIVRASLGDDAGLIGGASLVFSTNERGISA